MSTVTEAEVVRQLLTLPEEKREALCDLLGVSWEEVEKEARRHAREERRKERKTAKTTSAGEGYDLVYKVRCTLCGEETEKWFTMRPSPTYSYLLSYPLTTRPAIFKEASTVTRWCRRCQERLEKWGTPELVKRLLEEVKR